MKKQLKRMTAFILCLVLLFPASAQASASEDMAESLRIVRADRVHNDGWTQSVVLVLTFNSAYTAVGQTPAVTLTYRNGETKSIDPQQIRQAVYFMDGVAYPQLFITENISDGTVTVGAGAFQTADGTPSPAMTDQSFHSGFSSDFRSGFWNLHIFCRSKGVTAGNRLLEGKPVSLSFEPSREEYDGYVADTFLAALWAPYVQYADNGTPVDASFTPQGRGAHTFTARLNDFVSDYIPLEVAARQQTFSDVWNQYSMAEYLLAGFAFLIPGLGLPLGIAALMGIWYCSVGFWHGLFVRGDDAELFCRHNYGSPPEDSLSRSYSSRKEYYFGSYAQ